MLHDQYNSQHITVTIHERMGDISYYRNTYQPDCQNWLEPMADVMNYTTHDECAWI